MADKICASCGRRIEWRAKWARDWDQVRYCSAACRRRGVTAEDRQLEQAILGLLGSRPRSSTVSPADAARAVGDEQTWASLLEPARRAARRLVADGQAEIVQRGRVVDPSTARGEIGIRLVR